MEMINIKIRELKNIIIKMVNLPEMYAYPIGIMCILSIIPGIISDHPVFKLSYPISTYGLITIIIALTKTIPKVIDCVLESKLWKWAEQQPVLGLLLTDTVIRMRFFLYFGAAMNLFYVVLKITNGIIYGSLWLSFFGGYYLLLFILRLFIIHCERKYDVNADLVAEYRRYRACGIVLLLLNLILSVIVNMAVNSKGHFYYPEILLYGMALYSFYAVILAFVNMIRHRNKERPMFSAARYASITAAIVSMLSLEIAMIDRYSPEGSSFRREMTTWTGTVVCTIVLYMALIMIIRGNRYLKKVRSIA